ncbi:hypothetical protein [Methanoregula sp.]|jgi:hypothetical protein|uniref:hypothetical protein n=1 Tax=Methanoregula sp. TaxID=2052170 RepID=UPI003C774D64
MTPSQSGQKFFGVLCGLVLILVWATLLLFADEHMLLVSGQANVNSALFVWIFLGPVLLFIGTGMYFSSRSDWSEMKRQQLYAVFKAGILGFFLWTLVMVLFPGIGTLSAISPMLPTLGGYLLMLFLMMFLLWRSRVQVTGHRK